MLAIAPGYKLQPHAPPGVPVDSTCAVLWGTMKFSGGRMLGVSKHCKLGNPASTLPEESQREDALIAVWIINVRAWSCARERRGGWILALFSILGGVCSSFRRCAAVFGLFMSSNRNLCTQSRAQGADSKHEYDRDHEFKYACIGWYTRGGVAVQW